MSLILFESPDLLLKKSKLISLQKKVFDLEYEYKNNIKIISEFNVEYSKQLSDLIDSVSNLREKLGLDIINDEYKKNNILKLCKSDEVKIKLFYKRACKLCHPDTLSVEYSNKMMNIFYDLNYAYKQNDLLEVEIILLSLESGVYFEKSFLLLSEDMIIKYSLLLNKKIIQLYEKTHNLKKSSDYSLVDKNNWYVEIYCLQIELENELSKLRDT